MYRRIARGNPRPKPRGARCLQSALQLGSEPIISQRLPRLSAALAPRRRKRDVSGHVIASSRSSDGRRLLANISPAFSWQGSACDQEVLGIDRARAFPTRPCARSCGSRGPRHQAPRPAEASSLACAASGPEGARAIHGKPARLDTSSKGAREGRTRFQGRSRCDQRRQGACAGAIESSSRSAHTPSASGSTGRSRRPRCRLASVPRQSKCSLDRWHRSARAHPTASGRSVYRRHTARHPSGSRCSTSIPCRD